MRCAALQLQRAEKACAVLWEPADGPRSVAAAALPQASAVHQTAAAHLLLHRWRRPAVRGVPPQEPAQAVLRGGTTLCTVQLVLVHCFPPPADIDVILGGMHACF